jgi:alkylated DNA repair dioxygenase AlkB
VPDFLTKTEADALFEFCQTLQHKRNKGMYGVTKRRLSYACYSIEPTSNSGPTVPLKDAPEPILKLAAKLSAYAGKEINYLSIVGYADEKDSMNFHQHKEDKAPGRDATVYVVSLGDVRSVAVKSLREKKHTYELDPVHGSLYVLPASFNDTHEHAVLKSSSPKSLRIGINCKHLEPCRMKPLDIYTGSRSKAKMREKSRIDPLSVPAITGARDCDIHEVHLDLLASLDAWEKDSVRVEENIVAIRTFLNNGHPVEGCKTWTAYVAKCVPNKYMGESLGNKMNRMRYLMSGKNPASDKYKNIGGRAVLKTVETAFKQAEKLKIEDEKEEAELFPELTAEQLAEQEAFHKKFMDDLRSGKFRRNTQLPNQKLGILGIPDWMPKLAEEFISAGKKKLAEKYHPDKPGGSHEAMIRVLEVADKLAELFQNAAGA